MSDNMHATILRRMTGRQAGDAAEMPLSASRMFRLVLAKTASQSVGLDLSVTGMTDTRMSFDDLVEALDDGQMLIGLVRGKAVVGVLAIDLQFRAAVLEMQAVGQLIAAKAEERRATGTDMAMCEPFLSTFLSALHTATTGTEFDGWVDDVALGDRLANTRGAGFALSDHDYRVVQLDADLGVADRKGQLILALPAVQEVAPVPPSRGAGDWHPQFQARVAEAPVTLEALLHRLRLPLSQARALQKGQVLPLKGCTVHSVRLIAADGQKVGQAKLGQMGGMRAVRVEAPPAPQMYELPEGAAPPLTAPASLAVGASGASTADDGAAPCDTADQSVRPPDAAALSD